MTELQFDILDELYFVIDFESLARQAEVEQEMLISELREMIRKGWVKCFDEENELEPTQISPDDSIFRTYRFLATKKGLFAHNSK